MSATEAKERITYTAWSAVVSDCGRYRYVLRRVWDDTKPTVVWCMLNPSTADATQDDATIRRCVDFSNRWGYGGLSVVNLFAYRATDPQDLRHYTLFSGPVGPEQEQWISAECTGKTVVCAWGASFLPWGNVWRLRVSSAKTRLRECAGQMRCLGYTRTIPRQPLHPVRLAASTALEVF